MLKQIIEAILTVAHQFLCRHKKVTVYPNMNKGFDAVLLMCNSCGKMVSIESPGKYWCPDDLADKYLRKANKP